MPPIGYPGNAITKEARAKAVGGFESAIENVSPTGAPVVSAVLDNGDGTLTISGSNFGSKAQAAPYRFERFEGVAGQRLDEYDPDWIAYQSGGTTIRDEVSHSGLTCVGNTKPGSDDFQTNYIVYPDSDVVRVSYWLYYDLVEGDDYRAPGQDRTQVKNTRVTSTASAGGGGPYNGAGDFTWGGFFLQSDSYVGAITRNNGNYNLSDFLTSENNTISNSSNQFSTQFNAWNRVDMMIKLSDPGVANGEVRVHRTSAVGATNAIWPNQVTVGEGQSFKQNATILGTMIANYSSEFGNPVSVFIDDVYIDTTWSAVEIGDSPDYYACTRRDLLPPSAWSGNSLTVEKNYDPVPSGTNYIFVMNENGDVNDSGFEVTI